MSEVNVSDCLIEYLCKEGERQKAQVYEMLLDDDESWPDFMVMITALYQNFERFGNVHNIAEFIEAHGREGVNTLYAALGEITALKQRFTDLEGQRGDIDAQMAQISNDMKQACIRFGVREHCGPNAGAWKLPTAKSKHRQVMCDRQS